MSDHKIFQLEISEDAVGERLDKALARHQEIVSRSQATSLIDRGFVTFEGQPVKPARKVTAGEVYDVQVPIERRTELSPLDIPIDIVFEDDHLLVVNKPAGLVVHPAYGHRGDTLVNALVHHSRSLANTGVSDRPGIVHRLDKETTGLLVVAKTESALTALSKQFKRKTVHRIYHAVTYDHFKATDATITSYIRRHPADRKKFASERLSDLQEPQGKLAITHYKVKKTHPAGLSLVHCKLETGRTHQIRVHMSEAQHPIVGDPIYCTGHRLKSVTSVSLRKMLKENMRLLLHAAELGFVHPATNETLRFSTPWPNDLWPLLQEMSFL